MYLSVMKCQDGISRFGAVREKVTGQPHGFLPRDRCGQRKIEPPVTFRPAASNRQAWTAVVADLPDREYSMSSVKTSAALAMIAITALSTAIQHEVSDAARGRVMGLWMIAWAGLVPVGSLLAGPVIDKVGGTPVLLFGAVVALALTKVGNLDRNQLPERRPLTRPLPN